MLANRTDEVTAFKKMLPILYKHMESTENVAPGLRLAGFNNEPPTS